MAAVPDLAPAGPAQPAAAPPADLVSGALPATAAGLDHVAVDQLRAARRHAAPPRPARSRPVPHHHAGSVTPGAGRGYRRKLTDRIGPKRKV
jgi:hypothetical protein